MAKFSIPVQKSIKVAFPAPQSFAFITLEPIIKKVMDTVGIVFKRVIFELNPWLKN